MQQAEVNPVNKYGRDPVVSARTDLSQGLSSDSDFQDQRLPKERKKSG